MVSLLLPKAIKRILFFLFTLSAFSSLVLVNGCSKPECSDSKTSTQYLPSSTLSKVPYTGYDTLYFLNKQGDTCIVRGSGKQYYYTASVVQGGNPSCESDYAKSQGYAISFIPIQGSLSFILDLRNQSSMHISVNNYNYVFVFRVYELGIVGRSDDTFYIDTMTINEKLYSVISRAYTQKKTDSFSTNDNYQAYYNKEYGLLKVENKESNEEYSIIN